MVALVTMPWGRRLGGAEEMMWTLLRKVDPGTLELRLVFLEPGPFEREVSAFGLETTVIEAGRLRQPAAVAQTVRALSSLVRRQRPDVVLNWSPKAHLYGGPAAGRATRRTPVVWWQHGLPARNWLDRLATALPADAVGCSSQVCAAAQQRMRPQRATFVVHPGITVVDLPSEPEREALRAELRIPSDRFVVGIVGRLQPWKGQHRLIQAVAQLRSSGVPAHGLIVGGDAYELSPDYAKSLQALVADLGLGRHVTTTGQVADGARLISAMDMLVSASDSEPFGIVLLESMARGVPVVAVASGGPTEIIEDGSSGMLVPSSDPDLIAAAIRRASEDPGLRLRLARAGRERVEDLFTAERMAERFRICLEAVVARGGRA